MAAVFGGASLYVGDLDRSVTEGQLVDLFSHAAPVQSVRVCKDSATKVSLGYGYVNYSTEEEASHAMDLLNFTPLNGKPIRIMYSIRDPSLRKSGLANIFIKNLDLSIDNKSLLQTFTSFGKVLSCKIATDSNGQSKGYGYVQFQTEEAAQKAIVNLNGMLINDKLVYVGNFVHRHERVRTNGFVKFTNVYVKNLSESVTDDDLKEKFSSCGNITNAVVMRDGNGNSRGFGFVNFEKPDAAAAAVQSLNGETFNDRVLYVGRAQKKAEREAELKAKYEQQRNERIEKLNAANLYLKQLHDTINDHELKAIFSRFGSILSCKVMHDENGQSKGYGFVQFSSPVEANHALKEMNGHLLKGKPIYVAIAERKEQRRVRLQAHYSQQRSPVAVTSALPSMPAYHPGIPRLVPQQIYIGQGAPQPAGYGYQQQLMPGIIQSAVAPTYVVPFPTQRQGQPGQRLGFRRGLPQQIQHSQNQLSQRNFNQGFRYMQNGRNGVNPALMSQGLMGPIMQLTFDASGMHAVSTETARSPPVPVPIPALASALASASPENQRKMLGEKLYPLVQQIDLDQVGKVTGMLLEMDQTEVLHLLESPDALQKKVWEALEVLRSQPACPDAADQFA